MLPTVSNFEIPKDTLLSQEKDVTTKTIFSLPVCLNKAYSREFPVPGFPADSTMHPPGSIAINPVNAPFTLRNNNDIYNFFGAKFNMHLSGATTKLPKSRYWYWMPAGKL